MILTVTLNPSIDISYFVDTFQLDAVNRTELVTKTAGGKGLNVTRVLQQLNVPVKATGFLGGYTGERVKEGLNQMGIQHSFSPIKEETRNCIAILSENRQTEILEAGPKITEKEIAAFLEHFHSLLKTSDLITISGSLPKDFPADFYQILLEQATLEKCPVLLDTSGKSLYHALSGKFKPYLIKPNHHEIAELLNKKASKTIDSLITDLKNPLFDEVEYIVVTLGADGALLKHGTSYYRARLPKITPISPVGSGDASLAGMAAAIQQKKTITDILKTGMTTGILNTLETQTGTINVKNFDSFFDQMIIDQI